MIQEEPELIDKLSDDELIIIYRQTDLEKWLVPIKKNNKRYRAYISRLGRLSKKSESVRKNMPAIALKLCRNKDVDYIKIMLESLVQITENFRKIYEEVQKIEFCIDDLKKYSVSDYLEFLEKVVLNTSEHKIELDLFWFQLKMNGVNTDETVKKDVEIQWDFRLEVYNLRQAFQLEKAAMKQQLDEKTEELLVEKSRNNDLLGRIDQCNNTIGTQGIELSCQREKIQQLEIELKNRDALLDECYRKLSENTSRLLDDVNEQWCRENAEKVQINEGLSVQIADLQTKIAELESQKKLLSEKVKQWNLYVDSYLEHFESKLIIKKVDSILLGKLQELPEKEYVDLTFSTRNESLYVEMGDKQTKVFLCENRKEYEEKLEHNLLVSQKTRNLIVCNYCAAINAGMIPLICGYGARNVAIALLASQYGEMPTVISIPAGYRDSFELVKTVELAQTDAVVIESVFGSVNESVILPLLKKRVRKSLIFIVESQDILKYMEWYYYNYLYLIRLSEVNELSNNIEFSKYYDLVDNKTYSNEEIGFRIAHQFLASMSLPAEYIYLRGQILCNLLDLTQNKKDNLEGIKYYFESELKWILDEEKKKILVQLLEESNMGIKIN